MSFIFKPGRRVSQLCGWKRSIPWKICFPQMSQTCCGISLTEPSRQGTRFLQTGIPRRNEIRSGRYREEKFVQGPSLAGFNSYEEAVRTFSLPVPEFYNFASDTIDYWARQEEVCLCLQFSYAVL